MSDLRERLRAAITQRVDRARRMQRVAQDTQLRLQEPRLLGKEMPGWGEWPEIEQIMRDAERHCAEDLDVLDRHLPAGDRCSCFRPLCSAHEHVEWPCDEVQSLARRYSLVEEVPHVPGDR